MNHCLFAGDTVILTADIECGEYLPPNQRPDGYGVAVTARTGAEVAFVRHDGTHFVFNWPDAESYGIYDIEVLALTTEFDHQHQLCAEVFDEHQPAAYEWSTS